MTTRRPIDYADDLDETNDVDQHEQHHQRQQDNETGEQSGEEDEELSNLSPPAGRDTLYQLTTERSSWRSGRNGVAEFHPYIHLVTACFVIIAHVIPFRCLI